MLATSTKYALKALVYLAHTGSNDYVQVKTLSDKTDIPAPYLAKIMKSLASRHIVETKKGISGGVRVARGMEEVSFYDVCKALADPVVNDQCFLAKRPCDLDNPCIMHAEWGALKKRVIDFLQTAKINKNLLKDDSELLLQASKSPRLPSPD